jgi:hypothetical protein
LASNSERFQANSPPVVSETVEGETIVVNLDTGSYYDLDQAGGCVFALLSHGVAVSELADVLAHSYQLELARADAVLRAFAERLADEGLIVPSDAAAAPPSPPEVVWPAAFSEPVLNKYTDMQELLLLDPVHEVDEAGWPSKA